jgi:lactate dehydrogenase-like 2-hydroxyacid dehydrogenase
MAREAAGKTRRRVARARTTTAPAPIRVGLLGFGTIGTGVVKLLRAHRREIALRAGRPIDVVAIADLDTKTDRGIPVAPARLTSNAMAVLRDSDIDVIVELIGGYEPARTFVLEAIAHGKDVVTANKALLAVHGEELVAAAEAQGVRIGFEAGVGGDGLESEPLLDPSLLSLLEGLWAATGCITAHTSDTVIAAKRHSRSFIGGISIQRTGPPAGRAVRPGAAWSAGTLARQTYPILPTLP